ncbi:MAG: nicotinamide riboside transporter PnuC [Clostridia bacterium]
MGIKNSEFSFAWIIYFSISVLIVLIASILKHSGLALSISAISGVIFVLLSAKNKKISYVFAIINIVIYGVILFNQKIYGSAIYSLLYCFPMYVYGYFHWKKVEKQKDLGIQKLKKRVKVLGFTILTILIVMYTIIVTFIGGNFVIFDAIATILGFVSIYLLANKYIEQWHVFIIMNISGSIMWTILSIKNIANLPMALMYFVYSVNSIYGFITWTKKIKEV